LTLRTATFRTQQPKTAGHVDAQLRVGGGSVYGQVFDAHPFAAPSARGQARIGGLRKVEQQARRDSHRGGGAGDDPAFLAAHVIEVRRRDHRQLGIVLERDLANLAGAAVRIGVQRLGVAEGQDGGAAGWAAGDVQLQPVFVPPVRSAHAHADRTIDAARQQEKGLVRPLAAKSDPALGAEMNGLLQPVLARGEIDDVVRGRLGQGLHDGRLGVGGAGVVGIIGRFGHVNPIGPLRGMPRARPR